MSGMTFTMTEKYVAAIFTHALFGFMSVHFVLVALWLVIVQHARAPLFGQWDEVSGVKLVVWAVLLTLCGVSGLLSLIMKSKRAFKLSLGCWWLLSTFHACCLMAILSCGLSVGVIKNDIQETWTTCEMAVQLLADVIGLAFLTLLLDDNGQIDIGTDDFIREPLLSNV
ncbi:hypothetical protein GN958_ATG10750 [Phytophthora infestans]|uniref:Transmembrane protein n=1 Tax=Phytophthora infestans TaxID=4787 RepID=A0A8S9UGV8_PHYIN|nr:hypothetical protein GN958_ATG10750 [Phytophthora infestans]